MGRCVSRGVLLKQKTSRSLWFLLAPLPPPLDLVMTRTYIVQKPLVGLADTAPRRANGGYLDPWRR